MGEYSYLVQFLFSGLTTGSIYALMAVSLVIVYKVSRLICFAQGEFFVIGALTMTTLVSKGLPMPLAFVLAVLTATVLGALVERILIRPIQDSGIGTLIVMTVAISLTLRGLALVIWGKESHVLKPYTAGNPIQVLGATLMPQVLWIIGITMVVLLIIWFFFEKTTLGVAMRACAENRLGASLMGISTQRATILSWAWGSAIGALAGMAVAPLLFMQYGSGVMPMVKGFIAMSIGGLASRISSRLDRGLHRGPCLLSIL
jgi:branched-chain amino acid transport system permease protein